MKIGFDLDKIFIETPPLVPNSVINMLYKKRDNGILLYRIPSRSEQLFRKMTHIPLLRRSIKKNIALLQHLSTTNNKLYLISSRFKFLEPETNRLIKKYHLDKIFDRMYFNYENKQPHEFKNEVLKKLKLDIYVDDDFSLLRFVAKDNPKTTFYWYNQEQRNGQLPKNIRSVSDLKTIFQ